jgi:ferritin-like metal-binding protein YciE
LNDDLPPELDLESMKPDLERTRRFRERAMQGMVRLAPDVAAVFNSSEAVNEALRALIRIMEATANTNKLAA